MRTIVFEVIFRVRYNNVELPHVRSSGTFCCTPSVGWLCGNIPLSLIDEKIREEATKFRLQRFFNWCCGRKYSRTRCAKITNCSDYALVLLDGNSEFAKNVLLSRFLPAATVVLVDLAPSHIP